MATTLAGLEERGLVLRRPDAGDGRRSVLSVTEAGRELLTDRRSESVQLLAGAIEREFGAAERQELLRLLPLLDRLAERL